MVKRAQAGYLGLCSFLDENIGKILQAVQDGGWAGNTRIVYTSDHGDNVGSRGLWGKSTMYEESVGVPLIVAGPDFTGGREVTTPTSLLDIYPFIFSTVGAVDEETVTPSHPGTDLAKLSDGQGADRAVFSEYHGMGSKSAAYMIRKRHHKLVFYTDYPPQLFDLKADPQELENIADLPSSKNVMRDLIAELAKICDPEKTDDEAKATQRKLLERVGGKERVIARGDLGFSVPPGVRPSFD
jgi:choline-sulfatase